MLSFFEKNKKKKHNKLNQDIENNNLDFTPAKYTALQISRHIINYCWERDFIMSNLKLGKILYFIQAYYLLKYKRACFSDKIVAWDFGPVVLNVYHEYKMYGSLPIPKIRQHICFDKNDIWNSQVIPYIDNEISEKDKKIIDEVIEYFAPYTTSYLTQLTHNQKPWRDAYQPMKNYNAWGVDISNETYERLFEISPEAIYDYFINKSS